MVVYVDVDGCVLRGLDAKRLQDYFLINNCKITSNTKDADYIIYVSCGVDKANVEHCLKKINDLIATNSIVIILGCLPAIIPKNKLFKLNNVVTINTNELENIDIFFPSFKTKYNEIPLPYETLNQTPIDYIKKKYKKEFLEILKLSFGKSLIKNIHLYNFHSRVLDKKTAFIVPSYGCNNSCAYCGIKKAVGKLRSTPKNEIINHYIELINQGFEHFIFYADDIGAYGMDIKETFASLIEEMDFVSKSNITWDIFFLNPRWVLKYFDSFSSLIKKKRIVSLEIPVQHFSSTVLTNMNRIYDIKDVVQKIKYFKSLNSLLFTSTHIIFGFPNETKEDIIIAKDYLNLKIFNYIELLAYYDNPVSISYKMQGKIEEGDKIKLGYDLHEHLVKNRTLHSLNPPNIFSKNMLNLNYLLNYKAFK